MIKFVRKIVAGPKNRTVDEQFDLDLTYITDRIIAMAFPAAGFEKTYRNSIDEVSKFFKQRHGQNYLIINASNRKYEYQKFNYQVIQFFWSDHQAPPLTTLFQICQKMQTFLQDNEKNVVSVHCNHGKGRTGTAIISYLLFSMEYNSVKQALKEYNSRRFIGNKYGVDRPCQIRYLNYLKAFLELPLSKINVPLKAYKLTRVKSKTIKEKECYLRISQTRTEHVIYPDLLIDEGPIKFSRPLLGDIFIQVFESKWTGYKRLLRINFNMFFLKKNTETSKYKVLFTGEQIKIKQNNQNFQLLFEFQQYCDCYKYSIHKQSQCLCNIKRIRQQTYWDNMCKIIKKQRKKYHLDQENPSIKIQTKQNTEIDQKNHEKVIEKQQEHVQQQEQIKQIQSSPKFERLFYNENE